MLDAGTIRRTDFEQEGSLRQFVIDAPVLQADSDGQAAQELFDRYPEAEGIVVLERINPVGIIMRTLFFQTMGTRYGHSLYMKRPVRILMDAEFMKADVSDGVSRLGVMAMGRTQSKLYDYIVINQNLTYLGVISIRQFLLELSRRNEAQIGVLKNQQRQLISANEQEILLRKSLEYQSASVRNLLDHADQGFLWFGADIVIKQEYSYKCDGIFQAAIGGKVFPELMKGYFPQEKADVFRMAFDSYFKNNSPVTDNVYLTLLPADCVINGRDIHLQYRRIESDGQKAVMVILNDVTEKIALERAMEEDRNRQRLLIKAFTCQSQIRRMIEEFRELFSGAYRSICANGVQFRDGLNALFRAVHTFKGDFAQYGFLRASDELHAFEDALMGLIKRGESACMADIDRIMAGASPDAMLEYDLGVISEALGSGYFEKSEIVSFHKSRLAALEKQILAAGRPLTPAEVIRLLGGLNRKNVRELLEQYRDYLQYLADKTMKSMPQYVVGGDDIEVDADQYADFFRSLVHVYRNIMDHGIEADEERMESGKTQAGLVQCDVSGTDDGRFTLCIRDDGRGIDLDKVREKALKCGLRTQQELNAMTEREICGLILLDGLSTSESVSVLSGRGAGMPACLKACEELGGTLEIETAWNRGTSFLMTLPRLD